MISIDGVITGALVNVLAVAGRRLTSVIWGLRSDDDLDLAKWFDTDSLTKIPPVLSSTTQVIAILRGDEVQAALHELLAARLTDATEQYAEAARQALGRTLIAAGPAVAEALTDHYDEQIGALVARLEAADPPKLAQIRQEALATRMINILHAIERHTAALTNRPDELTETRFLAGYRRHVIDRHGKLEPPDFEQRRSASIEDIYVPTKIFEEVFSERTMVTRAIDLYGLAGIIDRSVLLGDPGGGKTTAANVLMKHFGCSVQRRIPFLITLREFAAKDPPERSVVGHIEHALETLYQCPAPRGLVDLLLLTNRAVVIFDGLDELLDTSRRRDVTTRVEQFCIEYPQAPVLVTSRLIGYDQARLDDRQFTCYRLGSFKDQDVATYARKWFALAAGAQPGDAESFLLESASVKDLRSNPLLLSLLCILYRGTGTLPQDRDEIYAKCTDLLIRDWDDFRRIRHELRVGRNVRPLLRHLAWWLFTSGEGATAVPKRELIAKAADFMLRSFENPDDARDAAREFVEFCSSRMWIFTDTGTTASGENLYGFTHRTFLEYFAAAQVAIENDAPEQLAAALVPRIAAGEWSVVAELAVQIKDRTSSNGAGRIYSALLVRDSGQLTAERARVLQSLAWWLRSVDPTPSQVRELTRRLIEECIAAESTVGQACGPDQRDGSQSSRDVAASWKVAISTLLDGCGSYREIVADEIDARIVGCLDGDSATFLNGIRLAASLHHYIPVRNADTQNADTQRDYWQARSVSLMSANATATVKAADSSTYVRTIALYNQIISPRQALDMPGAVRCLMCKSRGYFEVPVQDPYLRPLFQQVADGWPAWSSDTSIKALAAIGEYLARHPDLPWFGGELKLNARTNDKRVFELSRARYIACLRCVIGCEKAQWRLRGRDGRLVVINQLHDAARRCAGHTSAGPKILICDDRELRARACPGYGVGAVRDGRRGSDRSGARG